MIKIFLVKDGSNLYLVNTDNDADANKYTALSNARELTTDEYNLFGSQKKYAGNTNTSISGTTLDNAVITFTKYTDTHLYDLKMSEIREKRNKLLADTDWEIVKHTEKGETIPTALKTYRDALRDVTENIDTLSKANSVTMPERGL